MENLKIMKDVLQKGADVSNFGDPLEWQKKERGDTRRFYLIEIDAYDLMDIEPVEDKFPPELTDEEFKEIAMALNTVYTPEELVTAWNENELAFIDSYIRYL